MSDDTRFYGREGTIHRTEQLDVEVDSSGKVVSVWFRCQTLPFKQVFVQDQRAEEMREAYRNHPAPAIVGVTLKDKLGEIS